MSAYDPKRTSQIFAWSFPPPRGPTHSLKAALNLEDGSEALEVVAAPHAAWPPRRRYPLPATVIAADPPRSAADKKNRPCRCTNLPWPWSGRPPHVTARLPLQLLMGAAPTAARLLMTPALIRPPDQPPPLIWPPDPCGRRLHRLHDRRLHRLRRLRRDPLEQSRAAARLPRQLKAYASDPPLVDLLNERCSRTDHAVVTMTYRLPLVPRGAHTRENNITELTFLSGGIASQVIAGGAGGAILTALIGAIKNKAAA